MNRLQGTLTALVTPFDKEGALDEDAFRSHIQRQIAAGIEGLVPCGTTGEAATMSVAEQAQVIAWCVEEVAGRCPVVAGVGSSSTAESVTLAKNAAAAGASHLLLVTPPYNKPTPAGLVAHFKAVAEASGRRPIVFYNVPGRTAFDADESLIAAVCDEVPEVVAIKEATGDLERACRIKERFGDRIALLSGDDFSLLPFYSVGGDGAISVVSNVLPKETAAVYHEVQSQRLSRAQDAFFRTRILTKPLFHQTNPIPVKMALAALGRCQPSFRLPLVAGDAVEYSELYDALRRLGLS